MRLLSSGGSGGERPAGSWIGSVTRKASSPLATVAPAQSAERRCTSTGLRHHRSNADALIVGVRVHRERSRPRGCRNWWRVPVARCLSSASGARSIAARSIGPRVPGGSRWRRRLYVAMASSIRSAVLRSLPSWFRVRRVLAVRSRCGRIRRNCTSITPMTAAII